MVAKPKTRATYDDVLAAPEHVVAEILCGVLYTHPRLTKLPDEAYFTLAPDWGCEVLSPSTQAIDRSDKMTI